MCSLDRLIDLAKRTGDRLIIHDPLEGRDVVILDVDEYERLVLGKKDVRSLSSGQLLDQINRDIAAWRANKEMDERWEREEMLEDELREDESDIFLGNNYNDDWHTAGSILEDRYGSCNCSDGDDELSEDEILRHAQDEIKIEDIPDFGPDFEIEKAKAVPFQAQENTEVWKEEPLIEEEPVFYEEPV